MPTPGPPGGDGFGISGGGKAAGAGAGGARVRARENPRPEISHVVSSGRALAGAVERNAGGAGQSRGCRTVHHRQVSAAQGDEPVRVVRYRAAGRVVARADDPERRGGATPGGEADERGV